MKATLFKIERMNTHNGPGFRTVLYFKGCPLHCSWCHNPEGIKTQKQVWVNHNKCIGCQSCVNACPHGAVLDEGGKINVNQDLCNGCQVCIEACPTGAMEPIGIEYSVDELLKLIAKDQFLFESTGGGITATGGEPGLHAHFIAELFHQCKQMGIQTAFDTSGCLAPQKLEEVIRYTDLLFLDLKIANNNTLREYTGLTRGKLNRMLSWLEQQTINPGLQLEFRTPLVPGITDTEANLGYFAEQIVSRFPKAQWELCLFNDFCEDKYQKLKLPWNAPKYCHTHKDFIRIETFLKKYPGLKFTLSGLLDKKKDLHK